MILGIDQGTTGTTVLLFDEELRLRGRDARELPQIYPQPGWVEHDPEAIWTSCRTAVDAALQIGGAEMGDLQAIGLANQRETIVIWDRETGEPLHNAIVWQDRRTAERCRRLREEGREEWIHERTGLLLDPYFPATKLEHLFSKEPEWSRRAEAGEIAVGTVDSWLLWKLTDGAVHATDPTNASRTLLYNLSETAWDPELLRLFRIPEASLPEIRPSRGVFGETAVSSGLPAGIPIAGIAGDQQAALFGQRCFAPPQAKCTYGTGAFLLLHTGETPVFGNPRLLATAACGREGGGFALEGSVFTCGATIQWLRDGLGLLTSAAESEAIARSVEDTAGVVVVPAFVGLGAPYWDPDARGLISGLTRGATRAHLVRAALESMAYQVFDLVDEMTGAAGVGLSSLRVDGGASTNDWLMGFQAGLLGRPVERPRLIETTALGAVMLAGLGAGIWPSPDRIPRRDDSLRVFEPDMNDGRRESLLAGWRDAVRRARSS